MDPPDASDERSTAPEVSNIDPPSTCVEEPILQPEVETPVVTAEAIIDSLLNEVCVSNNPPADNDAPLLREMLELQRNQLATSREQLATSKEILSLQNDLLSVSRQLLERSMPLATDNPQEENGHQQQQKGKGRKPELPPQELALPDIDSISTVTHQHVDNSAIQSEGRAILDDLVPDIPPRQPEAPVVSRVMPDPEPKKHKGGKKLKLPNPWKNNKVGEKEKKLPVFKKDPFKKCPKCYLVKTHKKDLCGLLWIPEVREWYLLLLLCHYNFSHIKCQIYQLGYLIEHTWESIQGDMSPLSYENGSQDDTWRTV